MPTKIHFKDETPTKTIDKIKGILEQLDIQTQEEWYPSGVKNCYSMRVSVPTAAFGTNGKGINEDFTRASGYAEFMERLQVGFLSKRLMRDNNLHYADEKRMTKEECAQSCSDWFKNMSKGLSELFGTEVSTGFIQQKCFECEEPDGMLTAIPFYNVAKDSYAYFPKKSFPVLYSANGMAAGNTPEEAFVQAMSEIYERYNVVRFFCGDITPPSVPEEYLKQFTHSYETICSLRESGLEVIIKDCSMGEEFPMVAAVAIDKTHHSYRVHMGAHPVFEIALERSLTEMFQGKNINGVAATTNLIINNKNNLRPVSEVISHVSRGGGEYSISFFTGKPMHEFKPFKDRSGMSNAEMLKEFTDWFVNKGYDVYVRDISHLGFPSVSVAVPGLSEPFPHYLIDKFPEARLYHKYKNAAFMLDELSIEELTEYRVFLNHRVGTFGGKALDLKFLTGRAVCGNNAPLANFYGRMVFTYMEWFFNKTNAIKYAKAAIAWADRESANYLSCVCTYFEHLLAGLPDAQVYDGLSLVYPEEIVLKVRLALNNGENPFTPYIVHCKPELCENCKHNQYCLVRGTDALIEKVDQAVRKFDNEASFAMIRKIFGNV